MKRSVPLETAGRIQMNRDKGITSAQRKSFASTGILVIMLSITLAGCENALVEAVNTVRTETAAPRFNLIDAASNQILINGNLEFPATSVTGNVDIQLTAANTGRSNLVIDLAKIDLAMDSATEPDTFSIKEKPLLIIPTGGSANITLNFKPSSLGTKTATLTITTNDVSNLKFLFTVSGLGVSTAKDITSFSFKDLVSDVVISGTTISITVPFGTIITDLTAILTTTGTAITVLQIPQTSGLSKNNFTQPVEYLVTAADGTVKIYTVTVNIATKPANPTITTLEAANHQVTVIWPPAAGAISYDLYWSTSSSLTKDTSTKIAGVTSPYTHSGLDNKIPYYYFLIAVADGVESSQSDTKSAVPIQLVAYVTNIPSYNSGTGLNAYTINPEDGTLTPIPGSLSTAGGSNSSITVDPFSKNVYISNWSMDSNYDGGKVYTCLINPATGALSLPGSGYRTTTSLTQSGNIAVDPSGKFAYVLNSPGSAVGSVNAYTISATDGILEPVSGYTPLSTGGTMQADGIAVDPAGKFVYATNNNAGGNPGTIAGFIINAATGALTHTTWVPFTPGTPQNPYYGASSIVFSPSGNFYVGEGTSSTVVEAYTRPNANGLPATNGLYGTVGQNSRMLAIDPRGRFLYSISSSFYNISAFKIEADGTLGTAMGPYDARSGNIKYPMALVVDPTGNFLYALIFQNGSQYEGAVCIYRIDQSTGALTLLSIDTSVGNYPQAMAVGSLP